MISITKKFTFEAAHHLPNYEGKCNNLHGHSYNLEVSITRNDGGLNDQSMVLDFGDLKRAVNSCVVNLYDHSNLNTYFEMPTAENMAIKIKDTLNEYFKENNLDVKITKIKLYETANSFVEITG